MGEPTVVFDLLTSGYREWWFGAGGLIFVVAGVVFRWRAARLGASVSGRWFGRFFLGFAVLWTLVVSGSTYAQYHRLSRAAGSGQVSVVEGEVEGYQPPAPGGKGPERFSVSGKTFAYSDYVITSGFHQTRDKGGPIHRNGQHVRVTFVGDAIVKLEVWVPLGRCRTGGERGSGSTACCRRGMPDRGWHG